MLLRSLIPKEQMLYERDDIYVGKMHRYRSYAEPKEEFLCPFVSKNSVFIRWDGAVIPCMLLLHVYEPAFVIAFAGEVEYSEGRPIGFCYVWVEV